MSRTRKAFVVYVDLDEMPGTMYTQESAQNVVRNVLYQRMAAYNPTVSLAPEELQPEPAEVLADYNMNVENIMAGVRQTIEGTN